MSADPSTNLLISSIALLLIAGLTAYIAAQKGRNPNGWFIIGLLLGIFAPIILYFLPSLKEESNPTMTVSPAATLPQDRGSIVPISYPDDEKLWYYLDQNHQQYGPVSTIALRELWKTGRLELMSYVWTEGMKGWEKVDTLPDLKESLNRP